MFYCFRFFFRFLSSSRSFANSFAVSVWRCFITFSFLCHSSLLFCVVYVLFLSRHLIYICLFLLNPGEQKTKIVFTLRGTSKRNVVVWTFLFLAASFRSSFVIHVTHTFVCRTRLFSNGFWCNAAICQWKVFAPSANQRPQAVYTQQITLKCALACEIVVNNTKQYTIDGNVCMFFSTEMWWFALGAISNRKYQTETWNIKMHVDTNLMTCNFDSNYFRFMWKVLAWTQAHNIYFKTSILQLIDIFARYKYKNPLSII